MKIEYEATFANVDKDEVRERLKQTGAELVRPEYSQKRIPFNLPQEKRLNNTWLRVRDEGDKITLSLKKIEGDKIEDQKEICLEVSNFDDAVELLRSIGCEPKSYQETKRELWKLDGVDITIDEWPFIEPFVEVEGNSEEVVKKVSEQIGFNYGDALFCAVGKLYEMKYGIYPDEINRLKKLVFGMENPFIKRSIFKKIKLPNFKILWKVFHERSSLIFAMSNILILAVQVGILKEQTSISNTQTNLIAAENRPYIHFSVDEKISEKPDVLSLLSVNNAGKLPAKIIYMKASFIESDVQDPVTSEISTSTVYYPGDMSSVFWFLDEGSPARIYNGLKSGNITIRTSICAIYKSVDDNGQRTWRIDQEYSIYHNGSQIVDSRDAPVDPSVTSCIPNSLQ